MFLEFKTEHKKRYKIIRDYFISNNHVQGIYFIVKDVESSEIKELFLDQKDMNNEFEWRKAKKKDVKHIAAGIESGSESVLIEETGILVRKRKLINKTIGVSARKFTYVLKE